MKTFNGTFMLTTMAVFFAIGTGMANDNYREVMEKTIAHVYQATDLAQLQDAVNTFERIGLVESRKWEPQYYLAFGYLMMANMEQNAGRKDGFLDRAMKAVTKAKVLAPEESEIIALEGFVYMLRVTVDPGSRGSEFAPRALQTLSKATSLNPENPRALALSAQMLYGSAQFFGTSTAEACEMADKSLKKFSSYKSANVLAPVWGKAIAESLRQKCK
jgi:hypothetical protein